MNFLILSSRIGQVGQTITLDELTKKGADLATLIGGGFIEPVKSTKKSTKSAKTDSKNLGE